MISPAAGGIAALGPQAQPQMPGQADPQAIQNILQQGQGAGTPARGTGVSPNLNQLPIDALKTAAMGNNPDILPLAALGELNKRMQAAKMQQAAQGQQAMQQAAQTQNQPPIAQQVLAEAQQLDRGIGAQPYNYATGGVVAFSRGGELGNISDEMLEALRSAGVIADDYSDYETRDALRKQYRNYPNETANETARLRRGQENAQDSEVVKRILDAAERQRQAAAAASTQRRPAPTPAPTPTQPAMPTLMGGFNIPKPIEHDNTVRDAEYENRKSLLRSRAEPSAAELEARANINRLRQENLEAGRGDEATARKIAQEEYDAARARNSRLIPADYFRVAGGMDTRKGYGLKTLSQGMGSALERREAAQEAARKEYNAAMEKNRALQGVNRQLGIAEAERQAAIQAQDRQRFEAAQDKISELTLQRDALMRGEATQKFEQGIKVVGAEAQREQAISGRMSAEAAKKNAETQEQYRRDQAKLLAQKATAAGGPKAMTPNQLAVLREKIESTIDKTLEKDTRYRILMQRSPAEAKAARDRMVQERLIAALRTAGVSTEGIGAAPAASAEQREYDFTKITKP